METGYIVCSPLMPEIQPFGCFEFLTDVVKFFIILYVQSFCHCVSHHAFGQLQKSFFCCFIGDSVALLMSTSQVVPLAGYHLLL